MLGLAIKDADVANSDNVLRCGLTPKHIDVEELLSVVRWEELADPRLQADAEGAYHTPAEEFSLRRVSGEAEVAGPAIVLAVGGTAECGELRVDSGSAAWVPAGEEARVSGKAFIARPGA